MMRLPTIIEATDSGNANPVAVKIETPSVSENLLNGSSRLNEHKANRTRPAKPSAPVQAPVERSQPTGTKAPVETPIPDEPDNETEQDNELDSLDSLKERFISALTGHCKAEISLTVIVTEMIGADIERDEAIDWGIEAGLSESYVRSVVSRLYVELTGERKVRKGGGRKANKGAAGMAERAMKYCGDDTDKALALLLAARRMLEKWVKAGTVESNLRRLRNTAE
jgi:hypothetical protein